MQPFWTDRGHGFATLAFTASQGVRFKWYPEGVSEKAVQGGMHVSCTERCSELWPSPV